MITASTPIHQHLLWCVWQLKARSTVEHSRVSFQRQPFECMYCTWFYMNKLMSSSAMCLQGGGGGGGGGGETNNSSSGNEMDPKWMKALCFALINSHAYKHRANTTLRRKDKTGAQ